MIGASSNEQRRQSDATLVGAIANCALGGGFAKGSMKSVGAGTGEQSQNAKADPGPLYGIFSDDLEGSSPRPSDPVWPVEPASQANASPQGVLSATPDAPPQVQRSLAVPFQQAGIGPPWHLDWTSAAILPVFLLLLWLAIVFAASHTGWRRFAKVFSARSPIPGHRFRATSARFGSTVGSYVDVIHVTFGPEGLYVSATFPFRLFHRPFLVPWSSVQSIKRGERHMKVRYRICVDDPQAGKLLLRLPGSIETDLKRTRPDALRREQPADIRRRDALRVEPAGV